MGLEGVAQQREGSTGGAKRRVFHSLDAIRGLAAIAVMGWHAEALLGARPQSGYLAVDLFFVLSGVVIAHSYDAKLEGGLSGLRFMLIRIIRLYPLYIAGMVIAFLGVLAALKSHAPVNWTLRTAFASFGLSALFLPTPTSISSNGSIFPLNTPAWSLFFEMVVNILFVASFSLFRRKAMLVLIALAAVLVAAIALARGSLNSGFLADNWYDGLPRVIFSFGVGVAILRGRRLPIVIPGWVAAVLVVLILSIPIPQAIRGFYDLAAVLLLFPVLVASTLESETSAPRLCNLLGNLSYPVYVLHLPVLAIFTGVLVKIGHVQVERLQPFAGIAFLLVMIVVALLADRLYDVPVRKWLARRLLRRRVVRAPA